MHLTLITADLLPPLRFAAPVATPNLNVLLSRAAITTDVGAALEDAVLAAFDNNDGIASITARVDMPTENGIWLRADPVHLAVSRDNIQLYDSHVLKPTLDEMTQIAATLNHHFAQDGLHFIFPDAARGYLRVAVDDMPETTPLWQMGGANVFEHLPRQNNCHTNWRRVTNEIQMLLHDNPVNVARELRRQYPINGLWLWGGIGDKGAAQINATTKYDHLVGRLALARGLANLNNMTTSPLPEKFSLPTQQNTLVVLHAPTREIRAMSPYDWQIAVNNIDHHWIAPAFAAFDQKQLTTLTVIVANESKTLTINAKRKTILSRILHTKKSLTDYA
jgi:hypothetical protein